MAATHVSTYTTNIKHRVFIFKNSRNYFNFNFSTLIIFNNYNKLLHIPNSALSLGGNSKLINILVFYQHFNHQLHIKFIITFYLINFIKHAGLNQIFFKLKNNDRIVIKAHYNLRHSYIFNIVNLNIKLL